MILIVGGSGALGTCVARRLLAAGERVRVMTRTPVRLESLRAAGADVVAGDLLDRESVARACTGAGAVVAAAHSIFGRGRQASAHVDRTGHEQLIDVAASAGIGRFVYTSAYGLDGAFRAVPFFRIKLEVEQYLKASGLRYTILRPTAFMESHAHMLIGEPILTKGKVVLFGSGDRPRNFVAADDVAQFVVMALTDPSLAGDTIDIGGPDNLSNMDVVRLYERAGGRRAKVTHVPLAVPRLLSPIVRPFHAGLSQIMLAAALAGVADERFDAGPMRARFPDTRSTRLEDWVATTVAAARLPA